MREISLLMEQLTKIYRVSSTYYNLTYNIKKVQIIHG